MIHNFNLVDIPFDEYHKSAQTINSYKQRLVNVLPFLRSECFPPNDYYFERYCIYLIREETNLMMFLIVDSQKYSIPRIVTLSDDKDYELTKSEVIDYLKKFYNHPNGHLTDITISGNDDNYEEILNKVGRNVMKYYSSIYNDKDNIARATEQITNIIMQVIYDVESNYKVSSLQASSHSLSNIIDFFDTDENFGNIDLSEASIYTPSTIEDTIQNIPFKLSYFITVALHQEGKDNVMDYPLLDYYFQQMEKMDYRMEHQFDPAPRNKPIRQLLKDYNTKGKKTLARIELQKRVVYASFEEQKKILLTFLHDTNTDITFALKVLDKYWDPFYTSEIDKIWQTRHDELSARIIVHHFPTEYVEAEQALLAKKFNYLQVRLRLPANAPIDRTQITDRNYLHLCARQSIDVDDREAERILYQSIIDTIVMMRFKNVITERVRIIDHREPQSIIWSLGKLGKSEVLLRFASLYNLLVNLIKKEYYDLLREVLNNLGLELDFTQYDSRLSMVKAKKNKTNISFASA